MSALTDLPKRQAKESGEAGHVYQAGLEDLNWYTAGDEYIVVDELGIPLRPESYSDTFTRLLNKARLPKLRPHDAASTLKTYVHANDDDLQQGRQALAKIHKIA